MKKTAIGLTDPSRIPGNPNPAEKGLDQTDIVGYATFFGGLEGDTENENSQPKESIKGRGGDEDRHAEAYFKLLQEKVSKK